MYSPVTVALFHYQSVVCIQDRFEKDGRFPIYSSLLSCGCKPEESLIPQLHLKEEER